MGNQEGEGAEAILPIVSQLAYQVIGDQRLDQYHYH
jgi:hypothetical protein